MSTIRPDAPPSYSDFVKDRNRADDQVGELLKEIKKDRTRASELSRFDVKQLDPQTQRQVAQMLLDQLRGQIPPKLQAQLNEGTADPALLGQLANRLANSLSNDPGSRFGVALTPEQARAAAAEGSIPQQALAWAQFVQKTTHVPGGGLQGRAGSAAPKGEGAILAELLGKKINQGPGLRNPKLVERSLNDLSPAQRAVLLEATFGKGMANKLSELGITDPLLLVKAGALPTDRAQLAEALGLSRAQLITLLLRAEMLKIGPGRNGELAMRPDLLGALHAAGVGMMGSLAALRGLSREELAHVYRRLREEAGGFKKAIAGGRVPVKRDLQHWARAAARGKSDLLLADHEELMKNGRFSQGDAQELIQHWYLENLLWWELADFRRRGEERIERDRKERERQQQGEEEGRGEHEGEEDDLGPDLEYDTTRDDKLACFWITDYNVNPSMPGGARRMYVCIDPETGAIIPQFIEAEGDGGPT
jgi:hypothetical protein